MADTFSSHTPSMTSPPSRAMSVTPSDTTDLPFVSRAIFVGTPGDVRVRTLDGDEVTYTNLTGTKILRAARVFATGTTATNIIAEW